MTMRYIFPPVSEVKTFSNMSKVDKTFLPPPPPPKYILLHIMKLFSGQIMTKKSRLRIVTKNLRMVWRYLTLHVATLLQITATFERGKRTEPSFLVY